MDPIPNDLTSGALIELARATLRLDDRDGYTVPSPRLYPYQWMWDAGFIALGWRTFDEARAWRELRLLFDAQWDDGMVPHIVFHRTDPGYFPGPEVWRGRGPVPSSGITQPPVLASTVRRLLERAKDRQAAEREAHALYPRLLAYHRWLVRARDPHGTGLVAILHPWESGLDNSPSWDAALARAPRVTLPAARRDTAHVAAEQRPHAEQYERYLGLVALFRDLDYDPDALFGASPFRVLSVSFNAILHRANRDLLALARRFAPADEAEIEAWLARSGPALESLWSEGQQFYFSRDAVDGTAISVRTFEGFMPLYAGTPSTLRADTLAATAERWGNRVRYLLPSTDPTDPTFEPRRYWRGPVWTNVNWMLAQGFQAHGHAALAARLRADGLELASRSGMWEYYDPATGEGLGGGSFAWTAATVLDWLDDPDTSPPSAATGSVTKRTEATPETMAHDDLLRQRIGFLYAPDVSASVATRIEALLVEFEAGSSNRPRRDMSDHDGAPAQEPSSPAAAPPASMRRHRFPTQRDVVLMTYGDQVTATPSAPLAVLKRFLDRWAAGLVSTVHLLPFFPYSSDDGFSVIDYLAVDPRLGGWDDVAAIGSRFSLMFDAVLNHVSAESAWFKGYLEGRAPYRDYFIEVPADADLGSIMRPRTTPLLTSFTTATGVRRVWTTFGPDQIDLDYANSDVLLEMLRVLLSYVERGAELIRLDAVTYLWKEAGTTGVHHPKTHGVIKLLRNLLDRVAPHVTLITETNVPHLENVAYFGDGHDEAQMVYNFALPPLTLHTLSTGDARKFNTWAETLRTPSNETFFFNYLASHDGIGVRAVEGILDRPEVDALAARALRHGGFVSAMPDGHGGERPYELNINFFDALNDPHAVESQALQVARFLCAHAVMLALAGVPGLYAHSLVGSRGDPEGARHSGHARAINREKLPLDDLERELLEPSSLRNAIYDGLKTLIEIRRQEPAFEPRAPQHVLDLGPRLIAIRRTRLDGSATVYCLQNVRDRPQEVVVTATDLEDLLTLPNTPPLTALDHTADGGTRVTLEPYGIRWLVDTARQAPE